MILVTGATGHLGNAVINSLLNKVPADQIVALVRDEAKASALKEQGVTIRVGDYSDIPALDQALAGIDTVLLVSGLSMDRLTEHKNVVDAAKRAGVTHIAYTSVTMNNVETSPIGFLMGSHFATEEYIRESGLNYTFLRNGLYAEVIPMYIGEQALDTGIFFPAGQGKIPYALRPELAEAAAIVLSETGHENKIYQLTGSESLSFDDIAQELSSLSGKSVTYTDVDPTAFENQLKQAGVPEFMISFSQSFAAAIKNGDFDQPYNDLETLLGRKLTPVSDYLKAHYIDKQ